MRKNVRRDDLTKIKSFLRQPLWTCDYWYANHHFGEMYTNEYINQIKFRPEPVLTFSQFASLAEVKLYDSLVSYDFSLYFLFLLCYVLECIGFTFRFDKLNVEIFHLMYGLVAFYLHIAGTINYEHNVNWRTNRRRTHTEWRFLLFIYFYFFTGHTYSLFSSFAFYSANTFLSEMQLVLLL